MFVRNLFIQVSTKALGGDILSKFEYKHLKVARLMWSHVSWFIACVHAA